MALQKISIDTMYMQGFEVSLPVDQKVLDMGPHEQDNWAEFYLLKHKEQPLSRTYITRKYQGGQLVAMNIVNINYKEKALR